MKNDDLFLLSLSRSFLRGRLFSIPVRAPFPTFLKVGPDLSLQPRLVRKQFRFSSQLTVVGST